MRQRRPSLRRESLLRFRRTCAALAFFAVWQLGAARGEPFAAKSDYLASVAEACRQKWPQNRTVNVVCHGHSVPAGYFATPEVCAADAYPHLLREELWKRYPHAVINVIVTAIGGENSESGAARFTEEVLRHRPDVVTIDYGLNDRRIGLERARSAWTRMIEQAEAAGARLILLTPTGDTSANLENPDDPLHQHAEQIRTLARKHRTGLVDSLAAYQNYLNDGGRLEDLMSQSNHPNRRGHELVARGLLEWFPE